MTAPTWTLDEVILRFERYESTLAEDDLEALAWLRRLKDENEDQQRKLGEAWDSEVTSGHEAFKQIKALEFEIARLKDQRERLRAAVDALYGINGAWLNQEARTSIDALLAETADE